MKGHFFATAGSVTFHHPHHRGAIFLPDPAGIGAAFDVLLQAVGQAQRGLHLGSPAEEAFLLVLNQVVQDFFEGGLVIAGIEGQAGQGVQGLAQEACRHPGEAGGNLLAAMAFAYQQVGPAHQLVMVAFHVLHLGLIGRETALQLGMFHLVHRSGKDQGISRFQLRLERAGDEEVLFAVEAAAVFVGIGNALVPAGTAVEGCRRIAHLQVQVREARIQAERHAPVAFIGLGPGICVLLRQGMQVAEGQERLQFQHHRGRGLQQFVAQEDLVVIRGKQDRLLQ